MTTVELYLRTQLSGDLSGSSMDDDALTQLFRGFQLPDMYSPGRLVIAPWNTPENKHRFTQEALDSQRFMSDHQAAAFPTEPGWLTISGAQLGSMLHEFLDVELRLYICHTSVAFETGIRYLDWVRHTITEFDKVDKDEALQNRPSTAAEMFSDTPLRMLGMVSNTHIVESKPFRGGLMTIFKVPTRPEIGLITKSFPIDRVKAKLMCGWADKFDLFADQLEIQFMVVDAHIRSLKSFRDIVGAENESHELVRFLDREMMYPYTTGLPSALFYRARVIADLLRKLVWSQFA